MHCPACHSDHLVKNGFNPLHKQIYHCQECGRQLVQDPAKGPISEEKKALIDRLLFEKISLAGIARSVGVSTCWLQNYVNKKYVEVPHEIILLNNHRLSAGGCLVTITMRHVQSIRTKLWMNCRPTNQGTTIN